MRTPGATSVPSAASGPAPCDDCRRAFECGLRRTACRAFYDFVLSARWSDADRSPNKTYYRELFNDGDGR